jgi:hypothetical protein
MNPGVILVYNNLIDNSIIDKTLEEIKNYNWTPVWADKRYAGDHWMTLSIN